MTMEHSEVSWFQDLGGPVGMARFDGPVRETVLLVLTPCNVCGCNAEWGQVQRRHGFRWGVGPLYQYSDMNKVLKCWYIGVWPSALSISIL